MSDRAGLTVVLGGGGVGKTTTSAALGLAHARAGRRVLVVTVDPARRLADTLGVEVGTEACRIEVGGTALHARMPDSRQSVDRFAEWLFQDPDALRRVRDNGMYRELGNSLAGVHELVSIAFVDQELASGLYDEVVLDTAPSRHALEFLDYPARLGRMLEARSLEWVAGLARLAGVALDARPEERGLLSWGKKRVGNLVSHLVGAQAIHDIAALFAEFVPVRERWLGARAERRESHAQRGHALRDCERSERLVPRRRRVSAGRAPRAIAVAQRDPAQSAPWTSCRRGSPPSTTRAIRCSARRSPRTVPSSARACSRRASLANASTTWAPSACRCAACRRCAPPIRGRSSRRSPRPWPGREFPYKEFAPRRGSHAYSARHSESARRDLTRQSMRFIT